MPAPKKKVPTKKKKAKAKRDVLASPMANKNTRRMMKKVGRGR